jgi:hypothetical protein
MREFTGAQGQYLEPQQMKGQITEGNRTTKITICIVRTNEYGDEMGCMCYINRVNVYDMCVIQRRGTAMTAGHRDTANSLSRNIGHTPTLIE